MGETKSRKITVLKLVAISFASVAGGARPTLLSTPPSCTNCNSTFLLRMLGPYGFEDVVGAGGSTATILGMLMAPIFWSLPLALMTERNSFDRMLIGLGRQRLQLRQEHVPRLHQQTQRAAVSASAEQGHTRVEWRQAVEEDTDEYCMLVILAGVILFVVVINTQGADWVARSSMAFSFAGLRPFILMLLFGFPYMDITAITTRKRESSIKWGTFITILLWNSAG